MAVQVSCSFGGGERKGVAIVIECWIPEWRFREFLEAVVSLIGSHRSNPSGHQAAGTVRVDAGGRLDEFYWQRLSMILALTERINSDTWAGFSWHGRCKARCEVQRDDGYSGVCVRLEVPASWESRVEEVVGRFRAE
ncbi:hypothetical protein GobsT_44430 [Gemmata obscuriglobus]|nr:hypothetical protein GobsT_44430 [Gemmata obscuriglobus]VTS08962.1 unnamed protein product [Gemmata obscuriglobus UQM 2246]